MHTFFIGYCSYALDLIQKYVDGGQLGVVADSVKSCHQFRDPTTGVTHPRLHTLMQMKHLTAERRVRALFYWAHVLGTRAQVIIGPLRTCTLVVVSTLQLLLIAVRGHRAYTRSELDIIFQQVGGEFFKNLERLADYDEKERLKRGRAHHRRRPRDTRPPVPFKRMRR